MKNLTNWLLLSAILPTLALNSGCSSQEPGSNPMGPTDVGEMGVSKGWFECTQACDATFSECSLDASGDLLECPPGFSDEWCWDGHDNALEACERAWRSCVEACDSDGGGGGGGGDVLYPPDRPVLLQQRP